MDPEDTTTDSSSEPQPVPLPGMIKPQDATPFVIVRKQPKDAAKAML